jgi:hypothetical protein
MPIWDFIWDFKLTFVAAQHEFDQCQHSMNLTSAHHSTKN